MTLATTTQKKRKQNKKTAKKNKFETLWRKIEKQKKMNENRQKELALFIQRIESSIGDAERSLVRVELIKIEKLIEFFSRKSLSQWQRKELFYLIDTNFSLVAANPFSDPEAINALKYEFDLLFEYWFPEEDDYDDESFQTDETNNQQAPMDDATNLGEDLFGDINEQLNDINEDPINADEAAEDESVDQAFFERLFDEFTKHTDTHDDERAEEEKIKKFNQLLKRSSINGMFRRIAKVLHPDKEQDEQRKDEKHQLMSSLIEARDQNDIPTIFAMYAEYVGEMPEDLAKEDLENINTLLNYQLKQLKQDYDSAPYQEPKTAMFFDIFQAKTEKGILKNIKTRIKVINESISTSKYFLSRITSLAKLKPILEEVHYQRYESQFDDFI
tara:strand:- start:73 stop:1233 length:1161 start_codon:yes stop_codon:yes gene_type:complete